VGVEVRIDQGALARLLRRRGGRAYRKLEERTERVADIAEAEAPGSMGDFVRWRVEEGPGGLQGVITCDHPAVIFVLKGTRPHLIRPRRAKALRFEVDGTTVFAKLVRHPGTRANDFMARALRLGR
jgi:hypothetical protein